MGTLVGNLRLHGTLMISASCSSNSGRWETSSSRERNIPRDRVVLLSSDSAANWTGRRPYERSTGTNSRGLLCRYLERSTAEATDSVRELRTVVEVPSAGGLAGLPVDVEAVNAAVDVATGISREGRTVRLVDGEVRPHQHVSGQSGRSAEGPAAESLRRQDDNLPLSASFFARSYWCRHDTDRGAVNQHTELGNRTD